MRATRGLIYVTYLRVIRWFPVVPSQAWPRDEPALLSASRLWEICETIVAIHYATQTRLKVSNISVNVEMCALVLF